MDVRKLETRLIKRGFYTKCRNLVDKSKSFMGTLSFKLSNKIKDTYTSDERLEKHKMAMKEIEAIASKNVFEPCYYGDTKENYEWNNDDYEEEPYDYGIGFNYMSDEEYDEANGIKQEDDPIIKARTVELESSIENLVAKTESIKARATTYNLDGTEKESFDINIGLDDLCENVVVTRAEIDKLNLSPAEYEIAMDRKSESMMIEGLRRFLKSDEALKNTVENGGNQPL